NRSALRRLRGTAGRRGRRRGRRRGDPSSAPPSAGRGRRRRRRRATRSRGTGPGEDAVRRLAHRRHAGRRSPAADLLTAAAPGHGLGIVQEVVEIAAGAGGGAPVGRIVLEIGKLSAILPDAVRFCFALATEGTVAEGAVLEIIEIPGLARCRAC